MRKQHKAMTSRLATRRPEFAASGRVRGRQCCVKKPRAVPPVAFARLLRGQQVELFAVARELTEYAWAADNFKFCPHFFRRVAIRQIHSWRTGSPNDVAATGLA